MLAYFEIQLLSIYVLLSSSCVLVYSHGIFHCASRVNCLRASNIDMGTTHARISLSLSIYIYKSESLCRRAPYRYV